MIIKADNKYTKFFIYVYRNKRAAPDPCFNFDKVVALNFSVFEDTCDILAICTLAVLSVKTTTLTKRDQQHRISVQIQI